MFSVVIDESKVFSSHAYFCSCATFAGIDFARCLDFCQWISVDLIIAVAMSKILNSKKTY